MDEDAGLIGTGEDDQVPTAEDATEESSQLATTRPSEQPETTVEAPQKRQKRAPQPLQTDARQELTNDILRGWTQDYLHNMEDARRVKRRHNVFEAKKIAAYFVYGQGIGSVGAGLGQDKVAGPLVHFSGHELLQALLAPPNGRKHARSPSLTSSEERRVRVRSDEEERSRHGQDIAMADEAGIIGVGDEVSTTHEHNSFADGIRTSSSGEKHLRLYQSTIPLCHGMSQHQDTIQAVQGVEQYPRVLLEAMEEWSLDLYPQCLVDGRALCPRVHLAEEELPLEE